MLKNKEAVKDILKEIIWVIVMYIVYLLYALAFGFIFTFIMNSIVHIRANEVIIFSFVVATVLSFIRLINVILRFRCSYK